MWVEGVQGVDFWYIYMLQYFTTIVLLADPSLMSHNYHFFFFWEQLRSSLLAILKFINNIVVYNHYASIPFTQRETEIHSSCTLFTIRVCRKGTVVFHCSSLLNITIVPILCITRNIFINLRHQEPFLLIFNTCKICFRRIYGGRLIFP